MQEENDSVPNFFTFLAVPGTHQPRTVTERHGAPQNGTGAGKPRAGRVTPSARSCAHLLVRSLRTRNTVRYVSLLSK